jgi:hypothetical protein
MSDCDPPRRAKNLHQSRKIDIKHPVYIISFATYGDQRIAQIVIVDKTQISIFRLHRRTRIVESGAAFTPDPTGADGFDRRGVGEFASIRAQRIQPSHEPLAPLRLVFEADGTRKPANRSAGLLTGNLNPVCFSYHGRNDSRSHRRIGDTLGHTRYGTPRGSRGRQSGSGDGRTD